MSNSVVPPSASNSGASSTGISRRRNSTLSSSPNSSNPLTNTTVNPLANFLSVGPYRLPSSLVSGVTNRRASSGTSHRPAGSAGMVDSTSSDALLEPSLTERPSTNSSSAAGPSSANEVSDTPEVEVAGGGRQWGNISSMVNSISPLIPSTVAFQRAARRVIGPRNANRGTGNRRLGSGSAGRMSDSTSVDSVSHEVDDLLGLLAAMEEGIEEAENNNSAMRNAQGKSNSSKSVPTSSQEAQTSSSLSAEAIASTSESRGVKSLPKTDDHCSPKRDLECSAPANPPEVGDEAKTEEHLAETANKHEAKTDEVGEEEREGATEGTIAEATTEGGATVAEGAGGGEEPVGGNNDGNNSEEETEEDSSTEDPYWAGVFWQIPVICLILLCKFLQHYTGSLVEVLSIAFLFHGFNVIVKRNVVSNRSVTIGWGPCFRRIFGNFKKSFECCLKRRRGIQQTQSESARTEEQNDNSARTEVANEPSNTSANTASTSCPVDTTNNGSAENNVAENNSADNNVAENNSADQSKAGTNAIPNPALKSAVRNSVAKSTVGESASSPNMDSHSRPDKETNSSDVNDEEKNSPAFKSGPSSINFTDGEQGLQKSSTESPSQAVECAKVDVNEELSFVDLNEAKSSDMKEMGVHFLNSSKADHDDSDDDENCCMVQVNPNYHAEENPKAHGSQDINSITISPFCAPENAHPSASGAPKTEVPTGNSENSETEVPTASSSKSEGNSANSDKTDFVVINMTTDVTIPVTTGSSDGAGESNGGEQEGAGARAHPLLEALASISEEDQQAQESVQCVYERSQLVFLTLFLCPFLVFIFYGICWSDQALYWCLLFLPPSTPPIRLSQVLWLCLMLDFLARLCTVWVKACLCLCMMVRSSTNLLNKGKYYPILEMISQLYRSLLPIHPWFIYIYASYDQYGYEALNSVVLSRPVSHHNHLPLTTTGVPLVLPTLQHEGVPSSSRNVSGVTEVLSPTTADSYLGDSSALPPFTQTEVPVHHLPEVTHSSISSGTSAHQLIGFALFVAYLLHKKIDLVARGTNLWQAIKTLKSNTGSYGTAPSKSELESSGGKCPICHDQFAGPTLLQCSHIFCEACIVQWFQRERICPMCRAQIADDPMWKDGATSQMPQII